MPFNIFRIINYNFTNKQCRLNKNLTSIEKSHLISFLDLLSSRFLSLFFELLFFLLWIKLFIRIYCSLCRWWQALKLRIDQHHSFIHKFKVIRQMMKITLKHFHQFCNPIRSDLNHKRLRTCTIARRYYQITTQVNQTQRLTYQVRWIFVLQTGFLLPSRVLLNTWAVSFVLRISNLVDGRAVAHRLQCCSFFLITNRRCLLHPTW